MITNSYVRGCVLASTIGTAALLSTWTAHATERRFTYTYESATLGAGEREIEPWSTLRLGREQYYRAIDNRIEIEFGLSDRLTASWYLNLGAETADVPGSTPGTLRRLPPRLNEGISSEWKYKLLDNVADPLGLALYLEGEATSNEFGLESRIIVDKRLGSLLAALNVVGEYEWDSSSGVTEQEKVLELDVGGAYFFTPGFSAGIELQDLNEFSSEADDTSANWQYSVLSGGPVVSYSAETWWATITVLPQFANLKREASDPVRELTEHEKVQARLIFGAHF